MSLITDFEQLLIDVLSIQSPKVFPLYRPVTAY